MAYFKDRRPSNVNAALAGEIMHTRFAQPDGESMIVIKCIAYDTSISCGDPVTVWPTAAGYYCDGVIDAVKQHVGILQATPGATGAVVEVCMGGISRYNHSSAITATAWGILVDTDSGQELNCQNTTVHAANTIGWNITSGAITSAGVAFVYMDRPWKLITTT